jgi:hypothetical protein
MKFKTTILLIICILFYKKTNAQKNSEFSFTIGANISNPHQLFEGEEAINHISDRKAWGNIYGAILYKNKYQLSLGNELNEYTYSSNYNNDLFLNIRYYFLKDTAQFKPYLESGLVLKTFGQSPYIVTSQQSFHFNLGFIIKFSNNVSFDFGIGQQFRQMELYDTPTWSNDKISLTVDRFMVKTGLIFNVL